MVTSRTKALLLGIISAIMLAVVLAQTNPETAPPVMTIVVFALLYGLTVSIVVMGLKLMKFLGNFGWREKRLWRLASVVAIVPVAALVLQSIGQLTLRDVSLLLILVGIGVFYARRMGRTDS